MKPLLLFSLFIFIVSPKITISQEKIFFNEKWKQIDSGEDAMYYRKITKYGNKFKINDFYINGQPQFIGYSFTKTEPFEYDSIIVEYHKNGIIANEINFKNKKKNGISNAYYPNGLSKYKSYYIDDSLNGELYCLYPWGELKSKSNFINNKLSGNYISYFINQQIEDSFYIDDSNNNVYVKYDFYGNLNLKGEKKNNEFIYSFNIYDSLRQKEKKKIKSEKKFLSSNNCTEIYPDINGLNATICYRKYGNIVFHLVISKRMTNLYNYIMDKKINDNEFYFLYSPENKFMKWIFSPSVKEGIKSKIIDKIILIDIIENHFYSTSDFSGFPAFDALDKDLETDSFF